MFDLLSRKKGGSQEVEGVKKKGGERASEFWLYYTRTKNKFLWKRTTSSEDFQTSEVESKGRNGSVPSVLEIGRAHV